VINKFKKTIFGCFAFVIALVTIVPIFSYSQFSSAESEPLKHSLLPPDFNSMASEYNISSQQTSPFTPFDTENEVRFSGMSFSFIKGDDNKIDNQYIYVDNYDIPLGKDYSLFMWIYFDSIHLHDLTITLELENGSTISWAFTYTELQNLVKKNSEISLGELPYAWNKIELPFYLAEITGEIYSSGKLIVANKLIVNYTSNRILENSETEELVNLSFSNLLFYDIYISDSTIISDYSVIKQQYRFASFNFFPEEILNSVCVGDSLTLPTSLNKAVKYAWNGSDNLKTLSTVSWRIILKTPDENSYLYPSFGDTIEFDKEGTYQLYYQCFDTYYSNTKPIVSGVQNIIVNTLNPIYFDKSTLKAEVGKTYVINVYSSSLFTEVSDFTFTSSDGVLVEYKNKGVIEVTANKVGNHNIEVSVKGKRPASPNEKEYKVSFKITASSPKHKDNTTLKVILWSILGIFVVALLIFGIKKVVKANKYDVK